MAGDALDRLRAQASRGDYASMARLARALYADGHATSEVLRRCYGVGFPQEFFVTAEAGPVLGLLLIRTNQPWKLAVPPARGGPAPEPDLMEKTERKLFARDPDLVPLLYLLAPTVRRDTLVIGYRLTQLAAGRPTVFGIPERAGPADEVRRLGDSLLGAVHEHHTEHLRQLDEESRLPSNRGAGSVGREDLDRARSMVEQVEELQRQTAERQVHGFNA